MEWFFIAVPTVGITLLSAAMLVNAALMAEQKVVSGFAALWFLQLAFMWCIATTLSVM